MNHAAYKTKTRKMTAASLRFVIDDCREAIHAMPDNPKCGEYQDEICYCSEELNRRHLALLNA
jgi:hypothetical protein